MVEEKIAQSPEENHVALLDGVLMGLLEQGPDIVYQMIDEIPLGRLRDLAIDDCNSLIGNGERLDLDRLVELAATIQDPERKLKVASGLLTSLRQVGNDPDGTDRKNLQSGNDISRKLVKLITSSNIDQEKERAVESGSSQAPP